MPSLESDYPRYLAAKRTVDDRAVNERVLRRLAGELEGRDRVRVLNLGAGIGGVVERLVERDVFPERCEISCALVDVREENVAAARERLPAWARSEGYSVTEHTDTVTESIDGPDSAGVMERDSGFRIEDGKRTIDIEAHVADAFEAVERGEWDLLVGQAFLDLFDLDETLPRLLSALGPGGLCYFPITFDGGTIFEPRVDLLPSHRLQRAFHAHIDRGGGDSRAGRHLLTRLPQEDVAIVAAGSSDWVIHPRSPGVPASADTDAHAAGSDGDAYPADEATFLRFIVDTIADALTEGARDAEDRADDEPTIAPEVLREWRERRHAHLDSGALVYIAHQLDVLGRVPESDERGSQ